MKPDEQLCKTLSEKYTPEELQTMLNSTPRINQALYDSVKDNFTQEQLDEYQKAGEGMYNANFETEMPNENTVAVAYTNEMLKAGLHPSYLTDDEKKLMEWAYGPQWYKRYGYDEKSYLEIIADTGCSDL